MNDFKSRLDKIQTTIQDKKLEQARLQERLTTLKAEETKLLSQMKELGITEVSQLKDKITELETAIQDELTKCESLLK
jgi:predicted nuclease with TOPRIM domain